MPVSCSFANWLVVLLAVDAVGGTADDGVVLDVQSAEVLAVPKVSHGDPAPGKRVAVTPPEYASTEVFHTLYLPPNWTRQGNPLPVIFEYTGNFFPRSGSTGEPEDAALGYCLSGGQYIWVSLPYIREDHQDNAITWWGDEQATVEYAKRNVPIIIQEFSADPKAVFLCGFSRGAIGVNYLGLHDDEIAGLWTAFISHDHFDGVKQWKNTRWGTPLTAYREAAARRLRRVGNRPYLVSQNGAEYGAEEFIRSVLGDARNFTFSQIDAEQILGEFPNRFAKTGHTDRWAIQPSRYRTKTWTWMNQVVKGR